MAEKQIKITLKRSIIKSIPKHRKTVAALGLRKVNSSVVHNATKPILGMVKSISHLLEVEEMN